VTRDTQNMSNYCNLTYSTIKNNILKVTYFSNSMQECIQKFPD